MYNINENRRNFIKKAGLLIAGSAVFADNLKCLGDSLQNRPNILFIMSDDHAYQAISCFDERLIQTPNIDRIAREGTVFENSFCTNSICAPSRAVLLTGKFSHKNGMVQNEIPFDTSQNTFIRELKESGYETSLFGKWHLQSEPVDFDYYSILPGQGDYYQPDFKIQGKMKRQEGYVTDLITDQALEWIENRNQEKPFCMLLHHKAPHRNWLPRLDHLGIYDDIEFPIPDNLFDEFHDKSISTKENQLSILEDMSLHYDLKIDSVKKEDLTPLGDDYKDWAEAFYKRMKPDEKARFKRAYEKRNIEYHNKNLKGKELLKWKYQCYMRDYLSCIRALDENIGRVLDFLEKNGLKENTVVVYTSDQGFYLGEHGWFDKRYMYEESLRMPLLMMYPLEIRKGSKVEEMVQNIDFAPTFLDYGKVTVPEDIQGESFRRLFSKSEKTEWRDAVYYHYYEYPGMHQVRRHYGIRTERYKLIHFYYDLDEWEFYDLKTDPREMKNQYSNQEYKGIIDSLKDRLKKLQIQYDDTEIEKFLPVNSEEITHLGIGSKTIYHLPYSKKYPGGGQESLTDGLKGPSDMKLMRSFEVWQGYEASDLDVEIVLPERKKIQSVDAGFLYSAKDWIFPPEWVEFSWELKNGEEKRKRVAVPTGLKRNSLERVSYQIILEGELIKKIRIRGKNRNTCPSWHPGAGKKAWMFIDEVVFM